MITVDGSSGQVIAGAVKMRRPELTGEFAVLMGWADAARRLKVRANAETPMDAKAARKFGAEGIGLARTEHMFFEGERIVAVREMILADSADGRKAALAKLLPMQRDDFKELFEIMAGLPVTIRLLDPPLHEFLPHSDAEIAHVATAMGFPNSTRCWVFEACVSASPFPKSSTCRRAPSSRRRSPRPPRPASPRKSKSWSRWCSRKPSWT
jgi:pyruvate,orthophosphate dikinase